MKTKILIIGAKGMLGQELALVFKKDAKYIVFAWDQEDLDIANKKEVIKKINALKPKIIINAAAYNAVDKAEEKNEFILAKKINGLAPGYLAEISKKIGAIIIHYSSDYVFSGQPKLVFKKSEPEGCLRCCSTCLLHENFTPKVGFYENAKPRPISKYGESKLLGEKEIRKRTKKYYIIRLSKLFGKKGLAKMAKKSFFEVMLELGKKNKIVKVVNEEISCFTYAPDLAQKTKKIIESQKPFGIYHVVNSDPCTWYEAVLELYQQAKIKTKVIPVSAKEFPRPAKRPYSSILLSNKLNPLRSWRIALKDYLKDLKK